MTDFPAFLSAPAAVILAAGRGQRMMPLTASTPKPLLPVRGRTLLDWQVQGLMRAGVRHIFINAAYLSEKIVQHVHNHTFCEKENPYLTQLPDYSFRLSLEDAAFGRALETAGGISYLLPHLPPVFWLVAADVFAPDFPFDAAAHAAFAAQDAAGGDLAHVWLVPNPPQHPKGDFCLGADGRLCNPDGENSQSKTYTYSTIALLRRELFLPPWFEVAPGNPAGEVAALAPLLRRAASVGRVGASVWTGQWADVGTPDRLQALNEAGQWLEFVCTVLE